ncbi:MAG: ABC transporter permease [Clostridiales bacterium]|nr:ABC transporter permease [Clostridiales bacterium]
MRTKALILSDIRFQFRYGFYSLYAVFTLLYIGLLFVLPDAWRNDAAAIMIFTDPAAMGLFFMGAIVLFEKNERVLDSIAVSPVGAWEYVLSKLVSIGLISALVALLIGLGAGVIRAPLTFLVSVFLCSCLFSAMGLIVACKIKTLNQFIVATVPLELLTVVPAILWMFWWKADVLVLHPGVSMLMACSGRGAQPLALLSLLAWTALLYFLAVKTVKKMLLSVGGIKL